MDTDLVIRAQRGDEQAFASLAVAVGDRLHIEHLDSGVQRPGGQSSYLDEAKGDVPVHRHGRQLHQPLLSSGREQSNESSGSDSADSAAVAVQFDVHVGGAGDPGDCKGRGYRLHRSGMH